METTKITSAVFVKSSESIKQLPKPDKPEYAFIGRSNVGKSSLINTLCQRKNLAKTSATPGKTRLINHFLINDSWYLVDLPGYGYAKVSFSMREKFSDIVRDYLLKRESLVNTYVLIDSRLKPQKIDLEFMEWMAVNNLPFTIVFTKTDKLSNNELTANLIQYRTAMLAFWESMPPQVITSAVSGRGREEILTQIAQYNQLFKSQK